jgi:cytochrome c oxidase cbb3-type subunit 3
MISWKGTLKPKEMQKRSYVLKEVILDPKAPDGEVWVDEAVEATDTK